MIKNFLSGGNCVVGGKKGISPFIISFPSAAVLYGSPRTDSPSVINLFNRVSICSKNNI